MQHGHVKGIGGPGAPHAFRLEMLEDSGLQSDSHRLKTMLNSCNVGATWFLL